MSRRTRMVLLQLTCIAMGAIGLALVQELTNCSYAYGRATATRAGRPRIEADTSPRAFPTASRSRPAQPINPWDDYL